MRIRWIYRKLTSSIKHLVRFRTSLYLIARTKQTVAPRLNELANKKQVDKPVKGRPFPHCGFRLVNIRLRIYHNIWFQPYWSSALSLRPVEYQTTYGEPTDLYVSIAFSKSGFVSRCTYTNAAFDSSLCRRSHQKILVVPRTHVLDVTNCYVAVLFGRYCLWHCSAVLSGGTSRYPWAIGSARPRVFVKTSPNRTISSETASRGCWPFSFVTRSHQKGFFCR